MVEATPQEVSAAGGGRASEIEGAGELDGREYGGGGQPARRLGAWRRRSASRRAGCSEENPTFEGGGRAARGS